MSRNILAASALVLYCIFLVALIVLGDEHCRALALAATLTAAVSQFVAQDAQRHIAIYWVSIGLAYTSIAASFAALAIFAA